MVLFPTAKYRRLRRRSRFLLRWYDVDPAEFAEALGLASIRAKTIVYHLTEARYFGNRGGDCTVR